MKTRCIPSACRITLILTIKLAKYFEYYVKKFRGQTFGNEHPVSNTFLNYTLHSLSTQIL